MRRDSIQRGYRVSPGPLAAPLTAAADRAAGATDGLWRRDPSVWTTDGEVAKKIGNRLGWLGSIALVADSLPRLRATAESALREGIEDVVLLGMGGSSLAPEVLRAIIGVTEGCPRLHMLDSTDPAAVRAIDTDLRRTWYLLASKSGTTIEPNSLAAHFQHELQSADLEPWASRFIAITDPGTALATRADDEQFRDVFINPPDIGGRYSALSFFGMVPAALMGQDVAAILGWGSAMLEEAKSAPGDILANPAVGLGLLMAVAAQNGRDKLTLLLPPQLEPFGLWVEQLVAESTGKQGVGVVPIAGEPLAARSRYRDDRVFVRLRLTSDPGETDRDRAVAALSDFPMATIDIAEPAAIGGEFMRWEIATAVAGALIGINPFDEPNVQQAKDATNGLLARRHADGSLPFAAPDATLPNGVTLTLSGAARQGLAGRPAAEILSLIRNGDYVGILAYLGPDPSLAAVLHDFRTAVRDRSGAATMFGYGPRYLHSTGQLHKGGANNGLFIVITATPAADLQIPGRDFSFGTLELAQGLGDFTSLDAAGRRAVHIHSTTPFDSRRVSESLERLAHYLP